MKEFSLTILSNSSVELYGNTLSAFTNLLHSSITLEDNWEVGLSSIFMNKLENLERRKREIQWEYLNEYNLELKKIKYLIEDFLKTMENKKDGKNIEKRSGISDPLDYIESIFHPMQHLTEKLLEKALHELHENHNKIVDHAFIYTDIIQSNNIGSQSSRCLKVIPLTNKENHFNFKKIDYFRLQTNILKDISILITNGSGERINFSSSSLPTFCTLHFRKDI